MELREPCPHLGASQPQNLTTEAITKATANGKNAMVKHRTAHGCEPTGKCAVTNGKDAAVKYQLATALLLRTTIQSNKFSDFQ